MKVPGPFEWCHGTHCKPLLPLESLELRPLLLGLGQVSIWWWLEALRYARHPSVTPCKCLFISVSPSIFIFLSPISFGPSLSLFSVFLISSDGWICSRPVQLAHDKMRHQSSAGKKSKLWTLPKVNHGGFKKDFSIIPFCECCSAALRKVVSVGIRKDESLNIGLVSSGV